MPDLPIPRVNYVFAPDDGHNVFREKFGALSDEDWCQMLIRSIKEPVLEDVQFPGFPVEETQNSIHGNSGAISILEAADFYKIVKSNTYVSAEKAEGLRILDFGTGWGRIIRLFMRDFEFVDQYAFEPNFLSCSLARVLNPYVNILAGRFSPSGHLPGAHFDLVVAWSIFSHLSPTSATLWLKELARTLVPGGWIVLTTWGMRFLERLKRESVQREAGEEIHWYSSVCLNAAGSIDQRIEEYQRGDFVWFTGGGSSVYGEAFVGPKALERLLAENDVPMTISNFDDTSLSQDVFLLTRN